VSSTSPPSVSRCDVLLVAVGVEPARELVREGVHVTVDVAAAQPEVAAIA
jgi:hypothetical protein